MKKRTEHSESNDSKELVIHDVSNSFCEDCQTKIKLTDPYCIIEDCKYGIR